MGHDNHPAVQFGSPKNKRRITTVLFQPLLGHFHLFLCRHSFFVHRANIWCAMLQYKCFAIFFYFFFKNSENTGFYPIFAPMITLAETRGKPNKYNFSRMQIGKPRAFIGDRRSIFNSAKSYAKIRGLDWRFAARTIKGKIYLTRIA